MISKSELRRRLSEVIPLSVRTMVKYQIPATTLRELRDKFSKSQYVTVTKLAEICQVSRSTIYRWIDEGKLDYERVGGKIFLPLDQPKPEMGE